MNIFLCGFQGVGKTYFGSLLSKKMNFPFFDTDHAILQKTANTSIRSVHTQLGEEAFRALEEEVVEKLCAYKKSVIALGGGALCSKKSQEHIRVAGRLIYLYQDQETVSQRLLKISPNYLQHQDFPAFFHKRHTDFTLCAHDTICVDQYTNSEVIERILHGK